jgi:50S ribosomal subunit-associated GTPase HflX
LSDLEVDFGKILLVLNKIDLLDSRTRRAIGTDPFFKDYSTIPVSATRGDGLHQLRNKILQRTNLTKRKGRS